MNKHVVFGLFLLLSAAQSASAATLNLSNGESTYVGDTLVQCGGGGGSESGHSKYWVCTLSSWGDEYVGRGETQDAAKADARTQCNAVTKYPFCTDSFAHVSCEEVGD